MKTRVFQLFLLLFLLPSPSWAATALILRVSQLGVQKLVDRYFHPALPMSALGVTYGTLTIKSTQVRFVPEALHIGALIDFEFQPRGLTKLYSGQIDAEGSVRYDSVMKQFFLDQTQVHRLDIEDAGRFYKRALQTAVRAVILNYTHRRPIYKLPRDILELQKKPVPMLILLYLRDLKIDKDAVVVDIGDDRPAAPESTPNPFDPGELPEGFTATPKPAAP